MTRRVGGRVVNFNIGDQSTGQVNSFKYLESNVREDGRCLLDVKSRIALVKDTFIKRKELYKRI